MADEDPRTPEVSSEPSPASESERSPDRPSPLVAVVANLVLPPLGHIYAGATRRGVTMWVVLTAVGALSVILAVHSPGLTAMLPAFAVLAAKGMLTVDALLVARKRRGDPTWRARRWHFYLLVTVALTVISLALQETIRFEARAFRIPSGSMRPTLEVGDFMFAQMATYRISAPRRGDVVVYAFPQDPTKDMVHRVVGLPNEVIEVRDRQVFIDGLPLDELHVVHSDPEVWSAERGPRDQLAPWRIPQGEVFVMGDDRDNSNDGRFWGTLPIRMIRGRARVLYWSWDGARSRPRWERIGRRIE